MEEALIIICLIVFAIVVVIIDKRVKKRKLCAREGAHSVEHNPAMQLAKINQEIIERISSDFISAGWTIWDSSVHNIPGQMDRIRRAANDHSLSVIEYNFETGTALVSSSKDGAYSVSEYGCECMDFRTRGLPCKHMYLLAMELSEEQQ